MSKNFEKNFETTLTWFALPELGELQKKASFLKFESYLGVIMGLLNGLLAPGKSGPDLGKYLKEEIEEGISPVTKRLDDLEVMLDLLIALLRKLDRVSTLIEKFEDFCALFANVVNRTKRSKED